MCVSVQDFGGFELSITVIVCSVLYILYIRLMHHAPLCSEKRVPSTCYRFVTLDINAVSLFQVPHPTRLCL
jgi:hypothetical protein